MEFGVVIIILVLAIILMFIPFLKNLLNQEVTSKNKTKSVRRSAVESNNYNTNDAAVVTPFVYQDLNMNSNDYDSPEDRSAIHSTDAYSDSASEYSSSADSSSYDSSSDRDSSYESSSDSSSSTDN
jgi:Na+-transporting methylmalonyl-CoA/oxaloacetate decarboxylase gamma subunit